MPSLAVKVIIVGAAAIFALVAFMLAGVGEARATDRDPLIERVRASAGDLQRYIDLLKSQSQAERLAALSEMSRSQNPALVELAIESGLSSSDRAMQALAVRAAFRQVRSIVAKVSPPPQPSSQAQEVLKMCGEGVQYTIEGYKPETGHFEVRGQDHAGVGHINGATLSLTIEYGCSLSGILQPDGVFSGMVSAPYRKGALPASFAFR